PLGVALQMLAQDRDLQVAYASEEVDSITTPGASGELTVDEALIQLLRDTGLTFRHTGENGISILRAAPATPLNPEKKSEQSRDTPGGPRPVPARTESKLLGETARDSPLQEVRITAERRSENLQAV